jgi:leader peptidase (prepilin peptidase)/N-methyltransferase
MVLLLGTTFAALMGLAFGSFLNVCVSRWPLGESVVCPGSRCRGCGRMLAWWENVPLVSWLLLRGRCRSCKAWIGWRYPLVELAVAGTWAAAAWRALPALYLPGWTALSIYDALAFAVIKMALCWLLVCLAALDAEHLWLPDRLTLGGAAIGLLVSVTRFSVHWVWSSLPLHWSLGSELEGHGTLVFDAVVRWIIGIVAFPTIILLLRWTYRFLRGREGVGLGDAKLMLMLAAWLGLSHTLLAFVLGVTIGALVALVVLAVPRFRRNTDTWHLTKLPLGAFLCMGGIISALWGRPIIDAYLEWCGF